MCCFQTNKAELHERLLQRQSLEEQQPVRRVNTKTSDIIFILISMVAISALVGSSLYIYRDEIKPSKLVQVFNNTFNILKYN